MERLKMRPIPTSWDEGLSCCAFRLGSTIAIDAQVVTHGEKRSRGYWTDIPRGHDVKRRRTRWVNEGWYTHSWCSVMCQWTVMQQLRRVFSSESLCSVCSLDSPSNSVTRACNEAWVKIKSFVAQGISCWVGTVWDIVRNFPLMWTINYSRFSCV